MLFRSTTASTKAAAGTKAASSQTKKTAPAAASQKETTANAGQSTSPASSDQSAETTPKPQKETAPAVEEKPQESAPAATSELTYVLNVKTKKFHRPTCHSLPTTNRQDSSESRDSIISQGYEPCKKCNP